MRLFPTGTFPASENCKIVWVLAFSHLRIRINTAFSYSSHINVFFFLFFFFFVFFLFFLGGGGGGGSVGNHNAALMNLFDFDIQHDDVLK